MSPYERWERQYVMHADAPFPAEMMPCVERFFRETHPTLDPGRDVYPEVFAAELFFPLQRPEELRRMMRIARAVAPKVVMEIGADKGGGLYHWCMGLLDTVRTVIACEIRGTPYADEFVQGFGPLVNFQWLPCSSREPRALEVAKRCSPIDVLFLDGDKGAFAEDFDAYLPLMSPRGVVFFHDVKDDGRRSLMRAAWLRTKALGFRTEEVVDLTDVTRACAREQLGEPLTPHDRWLLHWRGASCGVGVTYMKGYGA